MREGGREGEREGGEKERDRYCISSTPSVHCSCFDLFATCTCTCTYQWCVSTVLYIHVRIHCM